MSAEASLKMIADRLEVVARVQDRGLGESWHCRDPQRAGGPVMVKLLRPAGPALPPALDGLLQRAKLARHDNLLRVFSYGVWRDRPYVVYELFEGRSLGDELDRARADATPLPMDLLREVFEGIVLALDAAHRAPKPMLHMAVDPSCVILRRLPDKALKVKVLDFGLGPWADADPETPPGSARALRCASPETFAGDAQPSSDVFALGALLREMLSKAPSAQQPLSSAGVERRRDDVPDALWTVIARATELDPARRHASIRAFAEAVRVAWAEPVAVRPAAPVEAPAPPPSPTPAPSLQALSLDASARAPLPAAAPLEPIGRMPPLPQPEPRPEPPMVSPPVVADRFEAPRRAPSPLDAMRPSAVSKSNAPPVERGGSTVLLSTLAVPSADDDPLEVTYQAKAPVPRTPPVAAIPSPPVGDITRRAAAPGKAMSALARLMGPEPSEPNPWSTAVLKGTYEQVRGASSLDTDQTLVEPSATSPKPADEDGATVLVLPKKSPAVVHPTMPMIFHQGVSPILDEAGGTLVAPAPAAIRQMPVAPVQPSSAPTVPTWKKPIVLGGFAIALVALVALWLTHH